MAAHGYSSIRPALKQDLKAALAKDPAATCSREVARCYPGYFALRLYRLAHAWYEAGALLPARWLSEFAHSRTGIDIHPGAVIGPGCFIDHGTGLVIGQTAVLGENVTLYHGVTLGALSVRHFRRGEKRHPTLEDGVTVYANATVLGGDTVIGHGSIIGANAFVTKSVPPNTTIPACTQVR